MKKVLGRPKVLFSEDLAARARRDLESVDHPEVIKKLRAIISASKHPVVVVADIFHVTTQSIRLWGRSYQKDGVDGLRRKKGKPKPSRLDRSQKDEVLSWIDECKTAGGEIVHWTLERLRYAIGERFGVTLGIHTIWVWLRKEGRRFKVPRPRHRQADAEAQEAFKKTAGVVRKST